MAKRSRCNICDREIDTPGLCSTCQAELDAPIHLQVHEPVRRRIVSPRDGMHVAGAVIDGIQVCGRCGDMLVIVESRAGDGWIIPPCAEPYPVGTKVERMRGGQGEYLGSREPNCPESGGQ